MAVGHRKKKGGAGRFLLCAVLVLSVAYAAIILVKDKLPQVFAAIGKPFVVSEQTDDTAGRTGYTPESEKKESGDTAVSAETEQDGKTEPEAPVPAEPKITSLRIRCAGDVMCHESQLKGAKLPDGSYSFGSWFDYVRPYLQDADVTMINVETTFPGSNYTGYPSFRSPDSLCEAVAGCGTDIAVFANNHMLDSGSSGYKRSIELMRENGMVNVGGYLPGEDTYTIYETTDGIKLGIVCYVYENTEQNGRRCLNGCYIPSELEPCINSFRYYNEGDMQEIRDTVAACRNAGADIVMAFMHWGEEYFVDPIKSSQDLAQVVVDTGVDFVVGSHPHVPEKITWLTNKEGRDVPVFYSLGNFVSNQRTETMGNTQNKVHTEEGLIANIELNYNHDTGEITFTDISAIPCWVEKYTKAGTSNPNYWIIPLVDDFENNAELNASGHLSRAKTALENVKSIIGEEYVWSAE